MHSGPGFTKPAHGYGEEFGSGSTAGQAEPAVLAAEDDWAGKGFDKPYQESE